MTANNTPARTDAPASGLAFRPGTPADSYAVFQLFEETLADLTRRLGYREATSAADPAALARMWEERRSLYDHLARTAKDFWLAERKGQVMGFARSIRRDGVHQLTELFVRPGQQSGGVGRELMARAFSVQDAVHRFIIASPDVRAQALYMKAGVYPHFPIYYFGREPETASLATTLTFQPVTASPETLNILGELDRAVLEYRRDADHTWLLANRQGYLYYRDGRPVGYGYLGLRNGPFALLEVDDFSAVLAHAENEAVKNGRSECGFEVPAINQAAVNYLLARGYRLDSFMAVMMSDAPFGKFEHYIVTSPPFFV